MRSPLDYSQDGHVVTMTLNVPEIRNSLSGDDMIGALEEACGRLNADMSVRVAILTGVGTVFSSGGNVKKTEDVLPAQVRRKYKLGIQRIPLAFDKLEVPVIAAVNGPAIGAGCDLACMCDIRIAAESARFAESFVKLGIIPGDGGAWLLPRVVGYSRACEMAFTGDTITANEALACGLVSKVVPDSDLMSEALKLATRIAANPPHAVRMAKCLIREGRHLQLPSLLELSAAMQPLAQATADHIEAVAAFKEKRKPDFRGK
jgi:enoyl-CoA hydratase/carnithine racemase